MATSSFAPPRHGLYYPYFHVRDERWLKIAALYWPRLVRVIPDDYPTRDSETVRKLIGELDFIYRRPPGDSVQAVASRFFELLNSHGNEVRLRYTIRGDYGLAGYSYGSGFGREIASRDEQSGWAKFLSDRMFADNLSWPVQPPTATSLAAIHRSQVDSELLRELMYMGLAVPFVRAGQIIHDSYSDSYSNLLRDPHVTHDQGDHREDVWVMMHERLISLYGSLIAEEFAAANKLRPTTDQPDAFNLTNHWKADRLAAELCGRSLPPADPVDDLAETIGLLALDLVVPDNLDDLPIEKIIELRRRHGGEFLAFNQSVEQVAAGLAELADVPDRIILEQYLHDVVDQQFSRPLQQLRHAIKSSGLDIADTAINVKTELPATLTLAGGAWLAGHPVMAASATVAAGVAAVARGARRSRADLRQNAPVASYLLHTETHLQPSTLLHRSLRHLRHPAIARDEPGGLS